MNRTAKVVLGGLAGLAAYVVYGNAVGGAPNVRAMLGFGVGGALAAAAVTR